MVAFVKGILEYNDGENIIVDTGNVGYNIMISSSVSDRLGHIGSEVKVYTYMSVREDAIKLYGFNDRDEYDIFRKMITVSGIGPKGAMGILSIMTPDDIRFAVLSNDSAAIAKAPGVGKKTAEKLIIELKDKVDLSDGINLKTENVVTAASSAFSAIKNDAVMALVALGYSQSAAYAAVNVIDINDTMTDTDILKLALKNI